MCFSFGRKGESVVYAGLMDQCILVRLQLSIDESINAICPDPMLERDGIIRYA